MPEVARLLGISERGVRDKIEHGQLQATKEGKRWLVTLPPAAPEVDAVVSGSASGSGAVVDAVASGSTPAEVERAIEATATRYMADFAGLYDRISADVAARYEQSIAAKDETIAIQRDAIAALRERLAAAEAEKSALAASPPLQQAPPSPTHRDTPDAPGDAGGFWGRVRRVFAGG